MTYFSSHSPFVLPPLILMSAYALDLAIGDPRWLPHPVSIIGSAISRTEGILRRHVKTPGGEKRGGLLLAALITSSVFSLTFLGCAAIGSFPHTVPAFLPAALLIYLTSTTIAVRGLVGSSLLVIRSVKEGNLAEARQNLSMIVGRDTRNLSEKDVLKATMETLAENLSDGIIAPVFFLVIGGLPCAMTYKAINTLDSMVGYKNARYINFGWASAKLDDIANYLPARATGLLIAIASILARRSSSAARSSLKIMLRDGGNHTSPNSGIPEAAMSGALGIRMGGPSTYGGVLVEKPHIGEQKMENQMAAAESAITIVKVTSLLGIGLAAAILAARGAL
ncbi:MAG TPA: adenosylcobinamide-phosphate synthase CbiB [Dissulfurispiraceae bacterium]